MLWLVLGLFVVPALEAKQGLPPFVLLSPPVFKSNHPADMKLLLFSETSGNVSVDYVNTVYSYTYSPYKRHEKTEIIESKMVSISRGDEIIPISVQVPEAIEGSQSLKWRIHLDDFGTFEETQFMEKYVSKSDRGYKAFVQTDKSVYKPGQPVRFRGFQIGADLKGIELSKPMEVSIRNSKGVEVYQTSLESKDGMVYQGMFQLADEVPTGEYKITLTGHVSAVCSFSVDEYVLPKYGIEITAPKYIPSDGKMVTGSVEAMYTYGKPLAGSVWLTFSIEGQGVYQLKETKMELVEGKADWEFDLELVMIKTKYLFNPWCTPSSLTITARVGEQEDQEPASAFVEFSQTAVSLTFNKNTQRHYSTGFPYYVEMDVKALSQKGAVDGSTVQVTMISGLETLTYQKKEVLIQDGKAFASFEVPEDACAVKITAELESEDACEAVFACFQPDRMVAHKDMFVRFHKEEPITYSVGDRAEYVIRASREQDVLFMVIMSKGVIVDSWSYNPQWKELPNGLFETSGEFTIPDSLNVRSRLLVLTAHESNGHLLADGLDLCMTEFLPHSLTFSLSKEMGQPGENITAYLRGDPASFVGISMSDKSLDLMRAPCEVLTKDQTLSFLRGQDTGTEKDQACQRDDPYQCTSNTEVKIIDVKDLLSSEGVGIDTNMNLFDYKAPVQRRDDFQYSRYGTPGGRGGDYAYRTEMMAMMEVSEDSYSEDMNDIQPDEGDMSNETEEPRLRNFFPESWLWTDVTTDKDGKSILTVTAPDTITGWKGSAFGLSPENGVGFSNDVEFITFLNFFVKLDLPYSGIVGERITIPINVFNYRETAVTCEVRVSSSMWEATSKVIQIEANTFTTVNYTVSLTEAGRHPITVSASSSAGDSDAIERSLFVQPGGVRTAEVQNILITEEDTNSGKRVLSVNLPSSFIPGSHDLRVVAYGDLLGNAATGIASLIQLPTGCGEQNMHKIAVNVFASQYLNNVQQNVDLPEYLKYNIEHNLNVGLQRQMTYRQYNGYSVFSGSEVSHWLTAFAYRTFANFPSNVHVPCSDVVSGDRRALTDLINNYNEVASLKTRQGWSPAQFNDESNWLSYFLISLLESYDSARCDFGTPYGETEKLQSLCGKLLREASDKDCCNAHMNYYALALCRKQGFADFLEIEDRCVTETRDGSSVFAECSTPGDSKSIEATGYAALYYMTINQFDDSTPLILWLASQKSETGGFRSSQDTVVALQALSTYAIRNAPATAETDMTILIGKGRSYFEKLRIKGEDMSVKEVTLPSSTGKYKIKWTGMGTSFVQLISTFHQSTATNQSSEVFGLKLSAVRDPITKYFMVSADFKVDLERSASMILIEMKAPTGFSFRKALIAEAISGRDIISRFDIKEGGQRVHLYVKPGISPDIYTVGMPLVEEFQVTNLAAAQVTITDYYEPSVRQTEFYNLDMYMY